MRRIKKTTTSEQFDLLKSEMSVHLAAARGYGMGADRATVDAEWSEILEKLNAIGPPHRSLAEWKKVWSDYRLRNLKVLGRDFLPKRRKHGTAAKKNKVSSNKTNPITYIAVDDEKPCLMQLNLQPESQHSTEEEYYHHQDPFKDDERNSSKEQYFNSSIHSLEEHEGFYGNDSNNYKSSCQSPHDVIQHNTSSNEKLNYLGQTLATIELQIKNQNIMMEHLSKFTENLSELMERHVTNLEKQNQIMERQLRATESHNMFLRRQEARRKVLSKRNNLELQKS